MAGDTSTMNSESIKIKKDALISALFSLSKAAQESSSATVDFFNALPSSSESNAALGNLAHALGSAANELQSVATNTKPIEGLANGSATDTKKEPVPNNSTTADTATTATPAAETKRKRAKKAPVDPNAPKKPNTIYFAFASDTRKRIREEREKKGQSPLANSEMTHEISQRWHNLTDEEKQPWKDKYQKEMEKYNEEKKLYQEGKWPNGGDSSNAVAPAATEESPSKKQKVDTTPVASAEKEKKVEDAANGETKDDNSETPKSAKKKKSKDAKESPEKSAKKDKKEKKKKRKSEGGNTSISEQ